MDKFKKLGLTTGMLKTIEGIGFTEPSEIQEKTIPLVLEGKDVLGSSATGSGKTLAFGAGIIQRMKKGPGVKALVLTPTRELAEQVGKNLRIFSKNYDVRVTEVYGGVSIGPQERAISHADIVVGTPGRILDHLERRSLSLNKVEFLVLDEADRMLDMGFIRDVEKIIRFCPENRQTLLFSATISKDIEVLSKRYMKDPVYISVESYVDPSKLKQVFYDVAQGKKFSLLVYLLQKEHPGLVMVFCNTRRNADFLAKNLARYKLKALAIHGGMQQNKRSSILKSFHENQVYILICTDVAARGLDIQNVSHVYNYDIPSLDTDYIHRIGRTARAGKDGMAVSLVSPRDYDSFRRVCLNDELSITQEETPEVENLSANFSGDSSREGGFRGGRGRSFGGSSDRRSSGRFGRRDSGRRDSGRGDSRGGSSGRRYGSGSGRSSFRRERRRY